MDVSGVLDNWSEIESDVSDASLEYSGESESSDQEEVESSGEAAISDSWHEIPGKYNNYVCGS